MQSSIFLCLSQARINWEGCDRKGIRHKNGGIDGDGFLISLDGVAPTQIVSVTASCYPPLHHKSRRSFLLAPAHTDGPRKRAIKWLWRRSMSYLRWQCGIVKCLLIAYFIGNISAKKYQNPFTCIKVIASQRWDV